MQPMPADRTSLAGFRKSAGWPLRPVGDPLLAGVGPSSYAQRSEHPELTRDGRLQIVPMRVATEFGILGGADPRGWQVIGGDKKVAGVVTDIWVDRADVMVRYLELEVQGGGRRLIPLPILSIDRDIGKVRVSALLSHQFAQVPTTQDPDKVTIMEEERISAFYAGGRMYAEPKRLGPIV